MSKVKEVKMDWSPILASTGTNAALFFALFFVATFVILVVVQMIRSTTARSAVTAATAATSRSNYPFDRHQGSSP
jgi:uncharacterized membrane protein